MHFQIIVHTFLSVLAMWHTGIVFLRKEVAVRFGADPGSAGMPYYTSNNMLRTVFMSQCSAVDLLYLLFDVYVGQAVYCCFCAVLFCAVLRE